MTSEWDQPADMPRRSRRWLWVLLVLLAIFAAGVAATVAVLRRSEPVRTFLEVGPTAMSTATPAQVVARARPVVVPPVAAVPQIVEADRRLTQVEREVARIDARAAETVDNADRAEGLLVAFAARRALDRGIPLGYIEGLLRERFGGNQPRAVATILSASRQPVTLEELQTGLDTVAPTLVAADPQESWWTGLRRELAGLVVVRRASTPSSAPVDRLERARRQLDEGHVDLALAEVARLPGRDRAATWIAQARRYAGARSALDAIETAALLAPHARRTAAI